MSFRHSAKAYLIGWEHPGGEVDYKGRRYRDAGIYSSPCVTQTPHAGVQHVLLSIGSCDYGSAYELLVREVGRRSDLQWTLRMRTLRGQVRASAAMRR